MRRAAAVLALAVTAACGGRTPAPPADDTAPAVAIPGGEIGVPECDRFAARYLACLDKVPEGSRAMARQAFDQTIEHWRLTAGKPDRRDSLAAACVQQEKATKAALDRYDCNW